jgi:ribosome maturation factor RimP
MKGGKVSTEQLSPVIAKVTKLVAPIASDLGLEVYDVEQRGGTIRVTLDTPPGSPGGVSLDALALATRLVSRELDHEDPVPGRYTLEVTSPGVERTLRTPAHFRREVGKTINVRLRDVDSSDRRIEGVLMSADESTATLHVEDPATGMPTERVIQLAQIDRARTVFVWGPAPKPGAKKTAAKKTAAKKTAATKTAAKKTAAAKSAAKKSAASQQIHEQKESS